MEKLNEKIVNKLKEKNETISFMESCTGGFLANEITNVNGASNVLKVRFAENFASKRYVDGTPVKFINEEDSNACPFNDFTNIMAFACAM